MRISKGIFLAILAIGLAGPGLAGATSPVDLGSAGDFAVLAKTGISIAGSSSVAGNVGVSPADAGTLSGFNQAVSAGGAFSTSALVSGKIYASDYADPTPADLTEAVNDMQTAYTDVSSRMSNSTGLRSGNIGGLTITPGIYKWTTNVTIPADVTLSGGADDIWIFQVAKGLIVSPGVNINLSGGAQVKNIFWAVAGQATIGADATINGNILDRSTILMNPGSKLYGRALAQSSITMDSSAVVDPYAASVVSTDIVIAPATPEMSVTEAAAIIVSSTLGSIIKVNAKDRPAVYFVTGGKKYLFVNRATYTTWCADVNDSADEFATLTGVTQAEFDAIPLGGNLVAKPGTLIKFDNGPDTYGIATGGKLFQLADTAAQLKLYGDVAPVIIQSGFRASYYDNGNAIGILPANSYKPK